MDRSSKTIKEIDVRDFVHLLVFEKQVYIKSEYNVLWCRCYVRNSNNCCKKLKKINRFSGFNETRTRDLFNIGVAL